MVMDTIVTVALVLFFGAILTTVLTFGVMFYLRWRKFNEYICIIWHKDAFGQLVQTIDKAGIFVDKATQNKRLFLQKGKVGLNPDIMPYIPSRKKKFIYLKKDGLKNYRFIKPVIEDKVKLEVGEEDVNWALNDYEKVKRTFEKRNRLKEVAPYAMFGLVVVAFLAIAIFILRRFDVLAEVSSNLSDAANAIAQAQQNTTVIP